MPQSNKVQGVHQTLKILEGIAPNLKDRTLKKVLRKGARVIRNEVRTRAPNATLRDAVTVKTASKRERAEKGEVFVGFKAPDYRLPHLFEFGTQTRSTKSGANRGMMEKRPFIRPAFDATKNEVVEIIGQALGDEVERVAERLSGTLTKAQRKKLFR